MLALVETFAGWELATMNTIGEKEIFQNHLYFFLCSDLVMLLQMIKGS